MLDHRAALTSSLATTFLLSFATPLPAEGDAEGAVVRCETSDVELARRSIARAWATGLAVTSTISDDLIATGALPTIEPFASGDLQADNPMLRAYDGLLRGALLEADTVRMGFVTCIEAGTVGLEAMAAEASMLAGIAWLVLAETFDDFRIDPLAVPFGPDSMFVAYDATIQRLSEAIALATTAGETDLVRAATAVRARAHFGRALWTSRRAGYPDGPLVASANAVADAQSALGLSSMPTGPTLTTRFDLWPDLIPSDAYATLTSAGTLAAALTDPVDATVVASLQDRLDELFIDITAEKDLPIVTRAELRLIVAEHALANGNASGFLAEINGLRTGQGLTPYSGGTSAEHEAILRHHRRAELFLLGRRLADQYRFSVATPEWTTTPTTLLPLPAGLTPASTDHLTVSGVPGPLPVVALVDARVGWGCVRSGASFAVGGVAELLLDAPTNVLPPAGCRSEAALFSYRERFVIEPGLTGWTTALGDAQPLTTDAPYAIHLWVRGPATAESTAQTHLAVANGIFALNRLGVRLTMTFEVDPAAPIKVCRCPGETGPVDTDCTWAPGSFPTPAPDGALDVYYVDESSWNGTGSYFGHYCERAPGSHDDLIFISATAASSTLAHEIGHALLRQGDAREHVLTGPEDGFDETNLMASFAGMDTVKSEARDRLTLGQVYRANVDDRSWLNHARRYDSGTASMLTDPVRDDPTRTWRCQCDWHSAVPCPPLSLDLAGPPDHTRSGTNFVPVCNDSIGHEVPWAWSGGDPQDWAVAMVDGRLSDGTCVDDLVVASRRRPVTGSFIFPVGNLDATAPCPGPELFVFSRYHGMLHWAAASPTPLPWSSATGDFLDLTVAAPGSIVAPHAVDVVYRLIGSASFADLEAGADYLELAFDRARVGVDFTPAPGSAPAPLLGPPSPMPCAPSPGPDYTAGVLNVYYTDTLPSGITAEPFGALCGTDGNILYLLSPGAPENELAHQVGHAFGLEDLTTGDLDPARLVNNLMRDPADGSPGARAELTVGQVFRTYWRSTSHLHALVAPGPPRCDAPFDPTTCPYLGADVPGR
jgi:hypothetical protein